jgi:hypothetical protein
VTRGTRPKKPSSSRGFARGAQGAGGAWGSWELKTENRTFFSSFFQQTNTKKKIKEKILLLFYFFEHPRHIRTDGLRSHGHISPSTQGKGVRGRARVRGREVPTRAYVCADAGARPCGRISLSTQTGFFTVAVDGKNPSTGKNAAAGQTRTRADVRTVNFTVGRPFRHP